MAAVQGSINASNTSLYMISGSILTADLRSKLLGTHSTALAYADLVAASGSIIDTGDLTKNRLTAASSIGDIGSTANLSSKAAYGQPFQRRVAGQPELPEWEGSVPLDYGNTAVTTLEGLANNSNIAFLNYIVKDPSGDDRTIFYLVGTLANTNRVAPDSDGEWELSFSCAVANLGTIHSS